MHQPDKRSFRAEKTFRLEATRERLERCGMNHGQVAYAILREFAPNRAGQHQERCCGLFRVALLPAREEPHDSVRPHKHGEKDFPGVVAIRSPCSEFGAFDIGRNVFGAGVRMRSAVQVEKFRTVGEAASGNGAARKVWFRGTLTVFDHSFVRVQNPGATHLSRPIASKIGRFNRGFVG